MSFRFVICTVTNEFVALKQFHLKQTILVMYVRHFQTFYVQTYSETHYRALALKPLFCTEPGSLKTGQPNSKPHSLNFPTWKKSKILAKQLCT